MLVPEPPVKLEGHCSVIHENTLYTYSENGFAAIPLKRDGGWTEPPTEGAELVSKAACVIGGVDGNEHQKALYVVGGTSSKSKNSKTPALQRYTFKDRKWKSISFDQANLVNRTSHSAVYLESIATIMVYGGSMTDSEQKSADSFSVTTGPEYILNSVTGKSPAILPALFAWDDETAVLFGGDTTETRTQFWSKGDGHWNLGEQNLTSELPEAKTALLTRSNGEKILQTFDTSASPVTVKQLFKSKQSDSSKKQERAANDMPKYDDSLAPTTTAEGASLAQSYGSDDQLVVLSGGGGTDSLSIFNQTSNSWVNSTKLFYGDKTEQEILGSITPTSSSQPSPTTSASSTPSEPVGGGGSSTDNVGVILGAVLGSLAGVAIILVLILFYIRRKKEKMRQAGGLDKDRLSFQDQGVEPLARSAYPMAESPAPRAAGSMDSLAIFSGNMGDEKAPKPAGSLPQHMQKSQPARPSPLNNIHSSDGDDKAIEAGASAVRPGDRTTDEGWGKYFQDNHTTPTLVGVQSPFDSTRDSKATIWPGNNNTNSLPPLDTNFLHQPTPLGRVNSGSPTAGVATSVVDGRQIVIAEGQSARISSADSASIVSEEDPERYNPIREHSWLGRPPSSAYSRSFYNPHSSTRELPSTAVPSTATPSTVDYRKHDSARTNTRGSSVLIPDGQPLPRNNVNSDMSWLNIHADR